MFNDVFNDNISKSVYLVTQSHGTVLEMLPHLKMMIFTDDNSYEWIVEQL